MRLHSPDCWCFRAEEVRTFAELMTNIDGIRTMLKVADQYEELASRSERLAKNYPDIEWIDEPPRDR
jgi:hypothetical protein